MTRAACPWCHVGTLEISQGSTVELWHTGYHCVNTGRGLEYRERRCMIAGCDMCEFVIEVNERGMIGYRTPEERRGPND